MANQLDGCFGDRYEGGREDLTGRSMKKRQRKSSGRMASRGFPIRSTFMWASYPVAAYPIRHQPEKLAEAVGLPFQQVQRYEKGANRVSSSRLVDLANALNITIPYFSTKCPPE